MHVVRRARLPEERPAIDAIHRAAFEATHRNLISVNAEPWFDPCGTCFVVDDARGEPCGFVFVVMNVEEVGESASEEPPLPRVDDLFVHPTAQNRGVGSALLARAEAFAAPATLHLCVLAADERARRFYARHGWCEGRPFVCGVDGASYLHASKLCSVHGRNELPISTRPSDNDGSSWSIHTAPSQCDNSGSLPHRRPRQVALMARSSAATVNLRRLSTTKKATRFSGWLHSDTAGQLLLIPNSAHARVHSLRAADEKHGSPHGRAGVARRAAGLAAALEGRIAPRADAERQQRTVAELQRLGMHTSRSGDGQEMHTSRSGEQAAPADGGEGAQPSRGDTGVATVEMRSAVDHTRVELRQDSTHIVCSRPEQCALLLKAVLLAQQPQPGQKT